MGAPSEGEGVILSNKAVIPGTVSASFSEGRGCLVTWQESIAPDMRVSRYARLDQTGELTERRDIALSENAIGGLGAEVNNKSQDLLQVMTWGAGDGGIAVHSLCR